MLHAMKRQEMATKFRWKNLKRRDNSADLGVHGRIILDRILGKEGVTGFIWLRIGTNCGLL